MRSIARMACALAMVFSARALASSTVSLRVLTYNVKGLPVVINPHFHTDRFAEIGRRLAARRASGDKPDIVVIQEAFSGYTTDIEDNADYPYVIRGAGTHGTDKDGDFSKTFSSGLIVMSRFPLKNVRTLSFNRDECGTWDCYANKGAVQVEVTIPGLTEPLILATTHLQSAGPYDSQRISQMLSLDNFFRPLYPIQGAMIFAGDFNSCVGRPSYDWWSKASGLTNAHDTCAAAGSHCNMIADPILASEYETAPEFSMKHDQVYYTNGQHITMTVSSIQRNFSEPYNDKPLSDHLGYETVFVLHGR